jgi:hypothetical protein
MQRHVVDWMLKNDDWHRAVSVDIEIPLGALDDPKRIALSVAVARRTHNGIEIRKFVLDEETIDDEARVFRELGNAFQQIRPLLLIGFNISRFDQPVLCLKLRQLENLFKQERRYEPWYWALRETIGRSYVLDMMDPVRFEIAKHDRGRPKFVKLEDAIAHPMFRHLPFKNSKSIVSGRMVPSQDDTKWAVIHGLWEKDRNLFEQYIEGDVHDTLLLTEDIFCSKRPVSERNSPAPDGLSRA